MAKADHSIDPRILQSAKAEFLAHGFERASLKTICENAEVTTGALYKRYSGKEALFAAVVEPTLTDLNAVLRQKGDVNPAELSDEELIKAWDMDEGYMMWWFQLLFDRREGFELLLTCAEGSSYTNFQHDWVEQMTGMTYGYYAEAHRRGLLTAELTRPELHVLLSAFWTTIYEPFIHHFRWEQIEAHNAVVCRLFDWYTALGLRGGDTIV